MFRRTIDVLEGHRAQGESRRVDQLLRPGDTGCFLIELIKQTCVDEPIDAKEFADGHPVLGESAGAFDGGEWRPDLGHIKATLEEVENGGDVFGQRHWRHGGDVLVLPHLGKLGEQVLQHHVAQLIRSGCEAPSEIAEEDMGVGSHSHKVFPP